MDHSRITSVVMRFFDEELGDVPRPDHATDLLASGILDSMAIVMLISHCEEALDLELEIEELTEDNFRSIDAIVHLLAGAGSGS